ncbi:MAG: hypothetical protein AB1758_31250, partial [Candidatus Eremiobacterota bacterium]
EITLQDLSSGERLTVDRPPAEAPIHPDGPPWCSSPQLSGDGNTVVFLNRELDRDMFDGMRSKVFTFDFEHARAQLHWASCGPGGGGGVREGADHVVVGGVRLRRGRRY